VAIQKKPIKRKISGDFVSKKFPRNFFLLFSPQAKRKRFESGGEYDEGGEDDVQGLAEMAMKGTPGGEFVIKMATKRQSQD
jgi:hypothetical protein